VRRQIYSDRLTQPVVVDSVYNRTAGVAEWNVYNDSRSVLGNADANRGELIVRDGGKGAAIGGIIGGAAGAGSVFMLGKTTSSFRAAQN
jgi:hypothetical protein